MKSAGWRQARIRVLDGRPPASFPSATSELVHTT
jgi:hypothetical protein